MPTPNIQYVANLNAQQVFNQLNIINQTINNTTNNANQNFGNLGSSIGMTAGVVGALTAEFIRLGQQAVRVLQEIISNSVDTAIQMDLLKTKLLGIFSGSQEAADEAFNFIQEKSKETGVDLSELAGAFIPKSESLAQFEKIAQIASVLATQDPLGMDAARIALQEALSGDFVSLRKRFEFVTKGDIENIKKLQGELGDTEGLIAGLEQILDRQGLAFKDLQNTAQVSFNKLAIAGQQLGGKLGVPIVAALEEASNKILSFLSKNEDDLIVFADTIGRAIADVISFISSIDLGQFDTQSLIEFGDYVFRIVEATKLVISQFLGWIGAIYQVADSITPLGEIIDYLIYLFSNLDDAMVTASQILAMSKAGWEGLAAAIRPLIEYYELLFEAISKVVSGDFEGAAQSLQEAFKVAEGGFDMEAAQDAARESMLESVAAMDEYSAAIDKNKQKQDELRDSLEQQRAAGTDAADAILANAAAQKEAAEQAEKLKEAQDKVNEAMADAEQDFQRKLEDIDIAYERKRTDIALEFAQKREDAARKNLEKLADIRKKYAQELEDAETELNREEEDIARRYAQSRLDLEEETRQKRVDIETDYRRKIEDIRTQFNLNADDAEKKRDAIAFLKAVQERDTKIQEAETERQRELEDARTTEEQKRQELETQRERELEEARIHNERKLEDLKESLEREIEAQNTAYSRELEDLKISEERKLEEAKTARERDIEDAQKAYDRKLQDLEQSLANELAILKEGNAKLEEEQARHNSAMANTSSSSTTSDNKSSTRSNTPTSSDNSDTPTTGAPFRATGGPVAAGYPYVVGEKQPELFVPNENGRIIPDISGIMSNPSSTSSSNYSTSKTQEINITTGASPLNDPIFIAQLKNIVGTELGKVL